MAYSCPAFADERIEFVRTNHTLSHLRSPLDPTFECDGCSHSQREGTAIKLSNTKAFRRGSNEWRSVAKKIARAIPSAAQDPLDGKHYPVVRHDRSNAPAHILIPVHVLIRRVKHTRPADKGIQTQGKAIQVEELPPRSRFMDTGSGTDAGRRGWVFPFMTTSWSDGTAFDGR